MRTHVLVFGWLIIISHIVSLLLTLSVLSHGLGARPDMNAGDVQLALSVTTLLLIALMTPWLIVSIGLVNLAPWARTWGIVFCVLDFAWRLIMPFLRQHQQSYVTPVTQTVQALWLALSIYGLIVLCLPQTAEVFRKRSDAPALN